MLEVILSAPFVLSAVIIISVIIAVLLEFEKNGWATTFFSLGTALVLWAYKGDIWHFVASSPMQTIYFIIGYIVSGLIWSLIKWKSYINKKTDSFNLIKAKFIKDKGEIKNFWKEWIQYLNSKLNNLFYEHFTPEEVVAHIIPKAVDKKALIVSWISYWPMSLGATLLNNPFRRFFEWIYGMISGVYDRMGNSAAKKMMDGIEKNEVVPPVEKTGKKQLNS